MDGGMGNWGRGRCGSGSSCFVCVFEDAFSEPLVGAWSPILFWSLVYPNRVFFGNEETTNLLAFSRNKKRAFRHLQIFSGIQHPGVKMKDIDALAQIFVPKDKAPRARAHATKRFSGSGQVLARDLSLSLGIYDKLN